MIGDKWSRRTQKCFDDFLEFRYSFNAPELILDTLTRLPLVVHDSIAQSVSLNTLLCKATMRYCKIEEGFWLLASELDVRQNVIFKSYYQRNLPIDYYLLTFSVFDCKFSIRDQNDVKYVDYNWTFSKPQTELSSHFYKNTNGSVFIFAINKQWADTNLSTLTLSDNKSLVNFFNGKNGFFAGSKLSLKTYEIMRKIEGYLINQDKAQFDTKCLKKDALSMIIEFFNNSFQSDQIDTGLSLANSDYYNVLKAEKIILDNLYLPFVGIDYISQEIRISPTKLKANFKRVFGVSLLQYHKEKNMLLAIQLIQNSDIPIKNIAMVTGYENAGKFAYTFKKRFGNLPRKVRSFS